MKGVIKKYKVSVITGIIMFISGGGLTQLTNSCIKASNEAQEWVAMFRTPTPTVGTSLDSEGNLLRGVATSIIDTVEKTKAKASKK